MLLVLRGLLVAIMAVAWTVAMSTSAHSSPSSDDDEKQQQQQRHLPSCRTVKVQEDFNLAQYISKPWYSHQQSEAWFQKLDNFYCVKAEYTAAGKPTKMGYTVLVNIQGQDVNGVRSDSGVGFCAYQPNPKKEPAKLGLAPCDLPTMYAGAYWVIAYKEGPDGFSLVSAGNPTVPGKTDSRFCNTGDKGLWILTRSPQRNEEILRKVRAMARFRGFDTTVLHNVKHENCNTMVDTNNDADINDETLGCAGIKEPFLLRAPEGDGGQPWQGTNREWRARLNSERGGFPVSNNCKGI